MNSNMIPNVENMSCWDAFLQILPIWI